MILLWRISTKCNFACGFCAYDRRQDFVRRSAEPTDVERVALLAAQAAERGGERLLVSWLGGEPFLWQPLLSLSAGLASHPAISISATTNGSRLHSEQVRNAVLDNFSELTLSVDGIGPIHDRLRGVPRSFDRLEQGARALATARKKRGAALKLRVNTILMRDTIGCFADLCLAVAGWGVDEITFNQLGGRDRPEFFPQQALSPANALTLRQMLPGLRAELAARGVRLCGSDRYLNRITASTAGESLGGYDCRPGEDLLFVDERGKVSPCSFTGSEYGIPISQIQSVDDVIALPSRFERMRFARRSSACDDCPSTQLFGKFAS